MLPAFILQNTKNPNQYYTICPPKGYSIANGQLKLPVSTMSDLTAIEQSNDLWLVAFYSQKDALTAIARLEEDITEKGDWRPMELLQHAYTQRDFYFQNDHGKTIIGLMIVKPEQDDPNWIRFDREVQ